MNSRLDQGKHGGGTGKEAETGSGVGRGVPGKRAPDPLSKPRSADQERLIQQEHIGETLASNVDSPKVRLARDTFKGRIIPMKLAIVGQKNLGALIGVV